MTGPDSTYTISQINQAIGAALGERFPDPFWVTGEIQGHDRDAAKASARRYGQVYFELLEKAPGSDTAKAAVKAMAWGDVRRALSEKLGAASNGLRLQDGLQVRFLCQVDFYWPRAALQLKVLDVDPNFTLGDLERARRELIEALRKEGLYDQNRALPWPLAPQTIGLVTSEGSAAYHDFMEELKSSGFAFRVRLVDARMQGEETERGVAAALRSLARLSEVQAIALVRGGGSRSDLIWFDKEKIARAVAACPKPVVTGIGHEIDLSVADLVAHRSCKTPTAAAQFFVQNLREFEQSILREGAALFQGARERVQAARHALSQSVRHWRLGAAARLDGAAASLLRGRQALALGARRHLALKAERLKGAPALLRRAALDRLRRDGERLEGFEKECRWKDPLRLLERGYSLVSSNGRLVKSVDQVQVGGLLEARLKDGLLTAAVAAKRRAGVSAPPRASDHPPAREQKEFSLDN